MAKRPGGRTHLVAASSNAELVAKALLGAGRDAEFALASALRATANAAKTETQREIAADAGIARIALKKRINAYARRRAHRQFESRVWVGKKVDLYPRHHTSIEAKAIAEGYHPVNPNRTRVSRRGDYIKALAPGKWDIFRITLDRADTWAMLITACQYHLRLTMRVKLAREIDRRLARRGGRKLARATVGMHEARMRRLLGEIV